MRLQLFAAATADSKTDLVFKPFKPSNEQTSPLFSHVLLQSIFVLAQMYVYASVTVEGGGESSTGGGELPATGGGESMGGGESATTGGGEASTGGGEG